MMFFEHLDECVEVIDEGLGLGDGETIDIFDDFVLISFDLLGHFLILYIMMVCLALYTSQIKLVLILANRILYIQRKVISKCIFHLTIFHETKICLRKQMYMEISIYFCLFVEKRYIIIILKKGVFLYQTIFFDISSCVFCNKYKITSLILFLTSLFLYFL